MKEKNTAYWTLQPNLMHTRSNVGGGLTVAGDARRGTKRQGLQGLRILFPGLNLGGRQKDIIMVQAHQGHGALAKLMQGGIGLQYRSDGRGIVVLVRVER